jgi:hypothetical protein
MYIWQNTVCMCVQSPEFKAQSHQKKKSLNKWIDGSVNLMKIHVELANGKTDVEVFTK